MILNGSDNDGLAIACGVSQTSVRNKRRKLNANNSP